MTLTFPAFERVGSTLWIVAGADKTSMCTSAKYSGQEGAFVKRRFMVLA